MRLTYVISTIAIFLIAGAISAFGARYAADFIEKRSLTDVTEALVAAKHTWVDVHADGLQIELVGTAPDEATRFRALSVANSMVDAERVIDSMNVAQAAVIAAPKFSIEILRNGDGVSLIGLIPAATDRSEIISSITELAEGAHVTDMLDAADHPAPEGWDAAVKFGLSTLHRLPKCKISISADRVAVTAVSGSVAEKRSIEIELARAAPKGISLAMDITAPRPVITPFTLRFILNSETIKFDACSADTKISSQTILEAAAKAGLKDRASCVIGLGVPTPSWGDAVATGIAALKEMGGGSITFSDADITLVALETTAQARFDRVIGELEAALPEVFSLHSVLPEPVNIDGSGEGAGPVEFVATRSPEGLVQLRGRITDLRTRAAVNSYARARFGSKSVYSATRLDEELPDGWPLRVLAGLEALAELNQGSVIVQAGFVEVRGVTGNQEASGNIARLLSEKLGASENYGIDVTYEEKLDPAAGLLGATECVETISAVLTEQKIVFAPGSADIEAEGRAVVARIAEIIGQCADVKMEIAGHTDSQGREVMNQTLSQSRAEAVLTVLMEQRILTAGLSAKGYGESVPIGDNGTQEGREANRRIEFTLILPKKPAEETTTLETMEAATPEPEPAAPATDDNTETPDEQN